MVTVMPKRKMPEFFINAFYESKFRGNIFVIKAGGKIIEDDTALDSLISNINDLNRHGIKVLLVYGGGRALDEASAEQGLEVKKYNGRRITGAADMDLMTKVVGGKLSLRVMAAMARCGVNGINFNAVPHDWMDVYLRTKDPIDFGFVGDIDSVDSRPIIRLFNSADFIAMPCIAYAHKNDTVCNINADTIATALAVGIGAHKLMFLSDVDGVQIDGTTAFLITAEDIPTLIENGTATGGMRVKLENCKRALEGGVRRIHLMNGLRADAVRNEIFESVGPGTMLITEAERENYMNEIEAQKMIEGTR